MTRKQIKAIIDCTTDFDVETIIFHRDGSISAIKDADKTFNAPETERLLVGYVNDFK